MASSMEVSIPASSGVGSIRSVEKTFTKYKCQKPVEDIEFGKEAQANKCHFRELDVQEASLALIVDKGAMFVNVSLQGNIITDAFDGGYELLLEHEDSGFKKTYQGVGSRKEKGISFCKEFVHSTDCAVAPFRGATERQIPEPQKGYWHAKVTFRANSGDVIGRISFEFKVATKTLRKVVSDDVMPIKTPEAEGEAKETKATPEGDL